MAGKDISVKKYVVRLSAGERVLGEGRLGDTAGGYLLLRASQGVCSEIGRSQSCIPMSSIALGDTVHIGNMF